MQSIIRNSISCSGITLLFFSSLFLLFVTPLSANAAQKGSYSLGFKGGTYSPGPELASDGFDSGYANEFFFNFVPIDNLSVEAGTGYFETRAEDSGNFSSDEETLRADYIILSLKGIISISRADIGLGGGVGTYYVQGEFKRSSSTQRDSDSDRSTVLAYHASVDITIHFTRRFFMTIEDRYIRGQNIERTYSVLGKEFKRSTRLDGNIIVFSLGFGF